MLLRRSGGIALFCCLLLHFLELLPILPPVRQPSWSLRIEGISTKQTEQQEQEAVQHRSAPFLTLVIGVIICLAAVLPGCATKGDQIRPRPLKAREILRLVSRGDDLPLPVVAGVSLGDVGQFVERPVVKGPPEDAPLCPGRHFTLDSHSRQVRAELLRGFGFTFVVQGEPQAGGATMGSRAVPLTLEVQHPPMRDPVTGEVRTKEILHIMGCIGHESDAVFLFTSDWERVNGPWILTLRADGNDLAAKRFDIIGGRAPDSFPAGRPEHKPTTGAADLRVRLPGSSSPPALSGTQTTEQSATTALAPTDSRPQTHGGATRKRSTQLNTGERLVFVLVSSNLYKENAIRDVQRLRQQGYAAELGMFHDQNSGRTWHTARLGRYPDTGAARQAARAYTKRTGGQAYVVVRSKDSVVTLEPSPALSDKEAAVASAEASGQGFQPQEGAFYVQVAACRELRYARADAEQLAAKGWQAEILSRKGKQGGLWHTVVLGPYQSRELAQKAAGEFRSNEGRQAFVLTAP